MSQRWSFGHIQIGTTSDAEDSGEPCPTDTPLRILILADFSGRTNRSQTSPDQVRQGRPLPVDRDNFDAVLAKCAVRLVLPVGDSATVRCPLDFAEMDDFHPDRLFQRVEVFRVLRDLRGRLEDPATFAAAAAELRPPQEAKASSRGNGPVSSSHPIESENLLEQMLETAAPADSSNWQGFLQRLVAAHQVPQLDYSKQAELLTFVDQALAKEMRAILHHPDFQALEAAWRALAFLVRRLDTDETLQLFLMDVSKADLLADLRSSEELEATGCYRVLVEKAAGVPGGKPWGVVVGLYTFDQGVDDVELLGRLAKIARRAGAPFLSAASPRLLGCTSLAESPDPRQWRPVETDAWTALRQLPEAAAIGLLLPRFLLRLPYGKESSPIASFDFEELPAEAAHEAYLWGNPAVAAVCLLAQAFSRFGWDFELEAFQEIGGLPLPIYQEDEESQTKPCAEVLLGDRAVEGILNKGLMPLVSIQDRDSVCLVRFQSVAEPVAPLSGRWR